MDTEVDGVRCVLVRVSRKAPARFSLSPREQEIARMVAKGYPNKMIASVLDISSWTVGTYLRRMFAKASVCSRAALVASFVESGHLGGIPEPAPPPQRAGPWEAGANRRRNELVTAAPLAKSKLPRR